MMPIMPIMPTYDNAKNTHQADNTHTAQYTHQIPVVFFETFCLRIRNAVDF